jgi:hypothetical protein
MPLYEVMLIGEEAPEVRLTDRALALGDLVEIAQRLWRVERSTEAGREDVERRFLLVLEDAEPPPTETPPAQAGQSDSRALLAPSLGSS